MGLQEIGRLIESRQVSPVALTEHMLDRIGHKDTSLKSYATVMAGQAMAAARAADGEIAAGRYRGPLHGVPVAVKDLCYTRGVRTMGGTSVLKDFIPQEDATVVEKLQSAGAIVLGKLSLTEGAMVGYNPEFPIPVNPWRSDRWPGCSSSGSGVATAAGLCFGAIGTDTGGSIRYPSSANGVVGLKPTYGLVSRHNVLALSPSLDHVGPMARRVADAAIMLEVIAGHDPNDDTSLDIPTPSLLPQVDQGIEGLRVGIDRKYALDGIDNGQAESIDDALRVLEGLGARIVDVKMADTANLREWWFVLCSTEAVIEHQDHLPRRFHDYGRYFQQVLTTGMLVSALVSRATRWRQQFAARFNNVLESVDVMVFPAGGAPAWPVTPELQRSSMWKLNAEWDKRSPRAADFTMPMDLAGTPAICLPSGFSSEGLPYSIQFAGRRLSEGMLCRVAGAYERATKWHERHPIV